MRVRNNNAASIAPFVSTNVLIPLQSEPLGDLLFSGSTAFHVRLGNEQFGFISMAEHPLQANVIAKEEI